MKAPTDILYVIPKPEIGGAEHQLLMLIKGLDRSRFRPHVICLDGGGSLLHEYREAADSVTVLNRRRAFDFHTLIQLVKTARSVRPSLIHTYLYIANLYGGWAARLAGVPALVVSQRGLGIDPQHSTIDVWRMQAFNLFIAQFADRLVVNSKAVANRNLDAGFPEDRTRVVYNGSESLPRIPSSGRAILRAELGLKEGRPLLCTVSRLDPKKDLETMLHALEKVVSQRPDTRLLVVGGGFPYYLQKLQSLTKTLDILNNVTFLGFRKDPQDILALCDVSLLSSITEGTPNAILESMRLGKPVVATRVGGIPELIEDGVHGWLTPPKDPDRFAEHILDLIGSPGRARTMGASGRIKAERCFTAEAMIKNTELVYDELLWEHDMNTKAVSSSTSGSCETEPGRLPFEFTNSEPLSPPMNTEASTIGVA